MIFDFKEIINRKDTDSVKYASPSRYEKSDGILPLWVADMDFQAPPCVTSALANQSRHGIFGYSETGQDYWDILQSWFSRYFDWDIMPDWLIKTPGVVFAVCAAIRALTDRNDAVLIQQPVYYPFAVCIKSNHRRFVVNQLIYSRDRYSIDFDDFESVIVPIR